MKNPTSKVLPWLSQATTGQLASRLIGVTLLLGLVDYSTGHEASFSLFYLIPVSLAAWYGHLYLAYFIGCLSAGTSQIANDLAGELHSHLAVAIWNDLIHFSFFFIVASLLSRVKESLNRAKGASERDFLTGLFNKRALLTRLSSDLARASRSGDPITVGYLDLDNFKQVNDTKGHSEGDRLLHLVSQGIQKELRRSDLVARVGGDEFVVVLTECPEKSVHLVAKKILETVQNLSATNGWEVTASLGLVHLKRVKAFEEVEAILDFADALMYQAKTSGKNNYQLEIRN